MKLTKIDKLVILFTAFTLAVTAASTLSQLRAQEEEEVCVPTGVLTELTEQVTGSPVCATEVRPLRYSNGKIVSVEVKRACYQITVGDIMDSCGDRVTPQVSVNSHYASFHTLETPVSTLSQDELDAIGVAVVAEKGMATRALNILSAKLAE